MLISPLFVTWTAKPEQDEEEGDLRGCIGTFSPLPLAQGLEDYAKIAAFRDHRFSPITASELPDLVCSVSLLTDFEDCEDAYDWEIGKHGIQVHFELSGRKTSATFLPQVIPEQGWTQEQALDAAVRKAGSSLKSTQVKDLTVTRYQAKVSKLTYQEWQKQYKQSSD